MLISDVLRSKGHDVVRVGAAESVALAVRRHEVVRGMFAAIRQRDLMIEREVVQRDRLVAERATPATLRVT